MPILYDVLFILYCAVNIFGFVLMGFDKWISVYNSKGHTMRRIPENTLLGIAVVGGIGVWIGMYVFHHKTQKKKFYIGVPCICLLMLLLVQWILL